MAKFTNESQQEYDNRTGAEARADQRERNAVARPQTDASELVARIDRLEKIAGLAERVKALEVKAGITSDPKPSSNPPVTIG